MKLYQDTCAKGKIKRKKFFWHLFVFYFYLINKLTTQKVSIHHSREYLESAVTVTTFPAHCFFPPLRKWRSGLVGVDAGVGGFIQRDGRCVSNLLLSKEEAAHVLPWKAGPEVLEHEVGTGEHVVCPSGMLLPVSVSLGITCLQEERNGKFSAFPTAHTSISERWLQICV